ncbi:hypothetical protein ACROYT_G040459 [Oculina patagonica]
MSFNSASVGRSSGGHLSSFPQYQSLAETYGRSIVHKSYMSDQFARSSGLYHHDLLGHFGCVNAIEFSSNGGEFIVSGGDDRRVVAWNVEKCVYGTQPPTTMKGEHRSNIFCTVFDNDNRHIFSAGNDNQALRHDFTTGETVGMYYHDDPVYGLNIHPEDNNVFLTASDDGKVMLWDIRTSPVSGSSMCIARHESAFHAAVFNPVDPSLIATANSRKGVQLWDVRVPVSCLKQFSYGIPQMCAMGLKWNMTGDMITALRRRLPPVLYHVKRSSAIAEFHHPGYNNVCTMKSNCFAGSKDQYVVSGSDDFNVYIWEVPGDWADHDELVTVGRAFMVLHGHRSIVNQVRFNPATHMLISAGVEKVLKVWSPFPMTRGYNRKESCTGSRRELYSHSDYLGFIRYGGLPLSHDEYESKSTDEDPRMLAFFDSLIQREKDNIHSDSDDSFLDDLHLSFILQPDSSEESDSDHTGTSMSRLLMRELLHRPSPGSPDGETATNSSGQGVLRRLRHLRDAAVIRDLLNADSTSSEDETENNIKVFLPELPKDLENGQSTTHSPVQFKRHQSHTKRRYRFQKRSVNEGEGSSAGHVVCDSSSSDSDNKYSQQKSKTKTGRNVMHLEESSDSSSSSSDTDDDYRTTKKTMERSNDKFTHKRKKRKVQETDAQSPANGLETCETACHDSEHKTDGSADIRDNHKANNNSEVKVTKSNKTIVSRKTECSESHENNHQVTADESSWTEQSDHTPATNKKKANTQKNEEEKGTDSNR